MRFLVSAGGSGGHIYPAIALIEIIKKDSTNEIIFVGQKKGLEYDLIKPLKVDYWAIESYFFDKQDLARTFKLIKSFIKNYFLLKKKLKQFKPDVVIGFGGHVTLPVIYTASKMKIKTYIHEQNQIMGRANQFLSKYVNMVFSSYPKLETKNIKMIYTGNPIIEKALNTKPANVKEYGLNEKKKLVLILMGSQGAAVVNRYLIENLNNFAIDFFQIIYITGTRNYKAEYKTKFKEGIKVVPYIDNVAKLMMKADLIVSRAGASTISEIMALKKPSILIPSPYVPNNHQYHNAKFLFEKNAACYLDEKDIVNLKKIVEKLMGNENEMKKMVANLSGLTIDNSATLLYNYLKQSGERNDRI